MTIALVRELSPEIVHCELCRLPHRAGVVKCDECEHLLGTPVDWKALDSQLPELRHEAPRFDAP